MSSVRTTKRQRLASRHARIRARIIGDSERPRLNVYRSLTGMFAQIIDDVAGKTLVSVHSKKDAGAGDAGDRKGKVAESYRLGLALAEKAKAAKIAKVAFDRGGYRYHGRVQALADGARAGGLEF